MAGIWISPSDSDDEVSVGQRSPMRAPYSSSAGTECGPQKPIMRSISFVQGDEFNDLPYLIPGRVLTDVRPKGEDGNFMFHESEDPGGETPSSEELVAPWEQRWWFGDVRMAFVSTIRYYNSWVPWYGTRPSRVWWQQMSKGAQFSVGTSYDPERQLTKVEVRLPSGQSTKLNPGGAYRWSLVSAKPVGWNEDFTSANRFDRQETWVIGDVRVAANWTSSVPIEAIGPTHGYL